MTAMRPPKQPPAFDMTEEALVILERRGFEVRGKTAAEIQEIVERPPTKPSQVPVSGKRPRDGGGNRME